MDFYSMFGTVPPNIFLRVSTVDIKQKHLDIDKEGKSPTLFV